MSQTSPDSASADDPVTILRGWAKAYRDSPEHRFPSDPDAEFFPVDLELAAFEIERLRADYRFLTESWHVAKRNQFAAEAIARSRDHAQRPAVQEALEHARAYIDADVESMEPGWRSAKAIVELIDAALSDTSTDRQ